MNPSLFPMIPSTNGSSGTMVGDVMQLVRCAYPPLYKRGNEEWLANGTLVSYSSKYSDITKLAPGLAISYANVTSLITSNYTANPDVDQFVFSNNLYTIILGNSSPPTYYLYGSTDITGFSIGSLADSGSKVIDAIQTSLGHIYFSVSSSSISNIYAIAQNSAASASVGSVSGTTINCLATDNTYIFCSNSQASLLYNSSPFNRITLVNHVTGTISPTGGVNKTVRLVHYSPAAGGFLTMCDSGDGPVINCFNSNTNTTLYSVTTFPSDMPARPWYGITVSDGPGSKEAASSPTVTLIKVSNTKMLRTTNGTSYTMVDLAAQNLPGIYTSTKYRLLYDSVNSVFVAYGSSASTVSEPIPSFYYSSDGIKWRPGRKLYCNYYTSTPQNQDLIRSIGVTSTNIVAFMHTTSGGSFTVSAYGFKPYSTPDYVGSIQSMSNDYGVGNTAGTNPNMYVRIA